MSTRVHGWCTVCKRTGSCEHLQVPHDRAVSFLEQVAKNKEANCERVEPPAPPRTFTRAEAEALMLKAWNLGHLNATTGNDAYPAKIQRPIDIDFIFRVGP